MLALQSKNPVFAFISHSLFDRQNIDFWLKKVNPLWSSTTALGQIVQRNPQGKNLVSLKIRCNRHMQYGQAGQHHPVIVEIAGRRYERTYSLTQIDAEHVLLTLKKVPQGKVSTWLCEQAQVGDILEFGQPYGEISLAQDQHTPILLLAAGSGITPMYSLLFDLLEKNQLQHHHIHLMHWAQQPDDLAFQAQFSTWQQQYPMFQYTSFCTQTQPAAERLNHSHIDALGDLSKHQVFACGSSGFVQQAQQLCQAVQNFQSEAFSLNHLVESDTGFVHITLTKSQKTVTVPKGQPILLGLEHAQIKPTHGCRMGICNKCSCRKVEGSTQNLNDHSMNHEPHQDLRICVNSAKNDLVLDL